MHGFTGLLLCRGRLKVVGNEQDRSNLATLGLRATVGIAVEGVDLVPAFIEQATARFPGIPFRVASLTSHTPYPRILMAH